jgi:hypothetical protein
MTAAMTLCASAGAGDLTRPRLFGEFVAVDGADQLVDHRLLAWGERAGFHVLPDGFADEITIQYPKIVAVLRGGSHGIRAADYVPG